MRCVDVAWFFGHPACFLCLCALYVAHCWLASSMRMPEVAQCHVLFPCSRALSSSPVMRQQASTLAWMHVPILGFEDANLPRGHKVSLSPGMEKRDATDGARTGVTMAKAQI